MLQVGDVVRYLNSVGGGRVVRIDGAVAYVDEDGFETPVMIKEIVVVAHAGQEPSKSSFTAVKAPEMPAKAEAPKAPAAPPIEAFVETPEGEMLNIVLAYACNDIKHISTATYDAYLVNDSNYYLYYTYLTRGNDDKGWTTRSHGMVEPAMQIFLCEIDKDDLQSMDRVAVQFMPFKLGKEFDLKAMACIEQKLDTTKFFKLHCFQRNTYFDEPVIAVPIVRNDMPARQLSVDARSLEHAMKEKKHVDDRKPMVVKKKAQKDDVIVVDLHINELVDTVAGLSNADMLNLQIDKFREVMDANLKRHGQKIVFIHGKGEGVLRNALLKELNYRYKGHDVQDASFREYGFGATQVRIKPTKNYQLPTK